MALKFLKDKSWVCGEVIVRNLYGVPLNAAFKMFEVFRMKEDVTPFSIFQFPIIHSVCPPNFA